MPTYFLLLTMTPEGREASLQDPERLLRIEAETEVPGVECMGLYGVLGEYDFISMIEARDNEVVARFSLEFGVRAGAHVTTLPAIPIGRFERREPTGLDEGGTDVALPFPESMLSGEQGDGPRGPSLALTRAASSG